MDFYELVREINSSSLEQHRDDLPYAFNQSNRVKLENDFDLEVYDLIMKVYGITVIYKSDRSELDTKKEYRKYGDEALNPFTDNELNLFNSLDWNRLPHNLKAYIYDVIWLCNHQYESAKTAIEEYSELYREWFDELNWVQCVDYISRAIELAAKIGMDAKKDDLLNEVYNDVVRLNGDDASFLTISLIELMLTQNYHCDFNSLIPYVDRLIIRNEGSLSNSYILEQAYYLKANLYKKLKDVVSENNVYVQYADILMDEGEKLLKERNENEIVDNRNWFITENNMKKAIELYQNHGASDKAVNAQKRLIDIQKQAIKHIQMHEFKYDVTEFYKKFCSEYANHDVHKLIWDVIFAFGFQNKQKIREDVTKNSSPIILFPMQMLGAEGQTEFLLPSLNLGDENNILLHMYHKAREYEKIQGQTFGYWFIQYFRKLELKEEDLNSIFENNPIIPKGQEKDVQRGVYYGLIGHMSDALDKLAPKVENIIRNLAEMCGDLMTYYDSKEGIQQKKVLSQVFLGEKLNDSVEENILFTFDGLLQQKAGSNIRNRIGHGLNTESECSAGDCIYFVMIVLKFCALYCENFKDEFEQRKKNANI